MFITDNPVADAERYYEAQEQKYDQLNATAYCECCGKACGAREHYRLFGETIACSKECARKLLTDDDIEAIVSDWIEDQFAEAGSESNDW